ncbi:MAG: HAD-IIIC family phosphatase [bacterium]
MAEFSDCLTDVRRCLDLGDGPVAWATLCEGLRVHTPKPFEYEAAGRLIALCPVAGQPTGVPRLAVALLGSYTTEPLANAIRCAAALEGCWADVYEAPFQAFRQEILDPSSGLYRAPRDVVLLAVRAEDLQPFPAEDASIARVEELLERRVGEFASLWGVLGERIRCPVLQHAVEPLGRQFIGPAEACWIASPDAFISRFNTRCREVAPRFLYWLDTAALAMNVGLEHWFDPRLYYHGKYGFNPGHLGRYVRLVHGLLCAIQGRSKKCLVTDLDDTLWGGVVGDDGVDGLQLGRGSEVGEAHLEFCLYLRQLARRGVILAVCSKNDPALARDVFTSHPGMPLKLDDFAAFHCSWGDKVTELRALARELNISTDHMVFVDDNPAECELVRQQLPGTGVIQLDGDPSSFVARVDRGHWFDAVRISEEDRKRADSYRARRQAEEVRSQATDLPIYLRSLAMVARCVPASEADLPRLAQMEAKTNQFNLTTRRYDEAAIRSLLLRDDTTVLACRLSDRFADHGMVASMILVREADAFRIDSWLMSCRVFSRTLEHYMMSKAIEIARDTGVRCIVGEYVPTEKNSVVQSLFPSLGFTRDPDGEERATWSRELGIAASEMHTYVADADVPPAEDVPASR